MRRFVTPDESGEQKLAKLQTLLSGRNNTEKQETVSNFKIHHDVSQLSKDIGFHLNKQKMVEPTIKEDIVPEKENIWIYLLIVLDIAVYNQFNPLFMSLVLFSAVLLSYAHPGKLRDSSLIFIALLIAYLPTTYTSLHPGLRLAYSCQNVLFSLKIWNYLAHHRLENFPLKLSLMHFAHLMVFLRPQQPVTYSEINKRFRAIWIKIAIIVSSRYIMYLDVHPALTILSEGFLFYSVIDFLNEMWAVYLMRVSGWYIGPVFNEPYLSTSPREFWGRRWNLWVQDFQYNNIFDPIRKAGYPNFVAIIGVNIFACAFHEYMVYVSWLSFKWTGYMTLFFTLNFGAAMVEVFIRKSKFSQNFSIMSSQRIGNAITMLFLASTGHLFIRPFFGVWANMDGLLPDIVGPTLYKFLGLNQ